MTDPQKRKGPVPREENRPLETALKTLDSKATKRGVVKT